jgi:hypothetical protein
MQLYEVLLVSAQNPTLWEAIAIALFPYGLFSARPTATDVPVNSFYYATDTAVLYQAQAGSWVAIVAGAGSGDVVGPASAPDEAPVVFDGTTGKLIKAGGPFGDVVGPASATDQAPVIFDGTTGKFVMEGGPFGDVVGPASVPDGVTVLFDGTTGKLLKAGAAPGGGGALTLIETITVTGAAVTEISFASTLDGDTDANYIIQGAVVDGLVGFEKALSLRPNAVTSGQGSRYQGYADSVGAYGPNSRATMMCGMLMGVSGLVLFETLLRAKSGFPRAVTGTCSFGGGSRFGYLIYGGGWDDTTTNITELTVVCETANGIGVGSVFQLYKRQDS